MNKELPDFSFTEEGSVSLTQPSLETVKTNEVLATIETEKVEANRKENAEEASKLANAENSIILDTVWQDTLQSMDNTKELEREVALSITPENIAATADMTNKGLGVKHANSKKDLSRVENESGVLGLDKQQEQFYKDFKSGFVDGVVEATETVAMGGYSFLWNGGRNVASLMDYLSYGVGKSLDYFNDTDTVNSRFKFGKAYENVVGTEEEFLGSISNAVMGTDLAPQLAIENHIGNNGAVSRIGGKLFADSAIVGVALRGWNTINGFKTGFYGTQTQAQAYQSASYLANLGKAPTKDLIAQLSFSAPKAIGVAASRAAVGEMAYIASNFQDDYGKTFGNYLDGMNATPEFSWGLLTGFTALEAFGLTRGAKSTIAGLLKQSNLVKQEKQMGLTLADSFGSGSSIKNNALAIVQNNGYQEQFKTVREEIIQESSKLLGEGKITTETFDEVVKDLNKLEDVNKSVNDAVVGKVTRNANEKALINKVAQEHPYIMASATNLKSYKTAMSKPMGKHELKKTSYQGLMSKASKMAEENLDNYIVHSDGSLTRFEDYNPHFTEKNNNFKLLKTTDKGLKELRVTGSGKASDVLSVYKYPTIKNAEAYSFMVNQNQDVLSRVKANGTLEYEDAIKEMDSYAKDNPYVANALAQLLEDKPVIRGKMFLSKPNEYRKMADDLVIPELVKVLGTKKDIVKEAAKFDLVVTDREQFINNLVKGKIQRNGKTGGVIQGNFNKTPEQAKAKMVMTIDKDALSKMNQVEDLKNFDMATNFAFQKQLEVIGNENPALTNLANLYKDNGLVEAAKRVDDLVGDVMPKGLGSFFSKSFNASIDVAKASAQRLAETSTQNMYNYMGKRLQPLKKLGNELQQNSLIALNKFKKLVNLGFEVGDDFNLKLVDEVVDADGIVVSPKTLTPKNIIAWDNAFRNGLVNKSSDDLLAEIADGVIGDLPLPDVANKTGDLILDQSTKNFLNEYRAVNDELYSSRNSLRLLFDNTSGYNQPYHMNNKIGKEVNFIYKDGELVLTVSANTPEQLQKAVDMELKGLSKLDRDGKYVSKTVKEVEAMHGAIPELDDWLGWTRNVDDNDFKYHSGRQERTSIGTTFNVDTNIAGTLYDDLVRSSKKLAGEYQSAYFNKEVQYAKTLLNGVPENSMEARNYREYIALLNGRSINSSSWVDSINRTVDSMLTPMYNKGSDTWQVRQEKQVKQLLEDNGDIKAMNDFIVKMPDLKGGQVVSKLQEATTWSMLRFMGFGNAMMNVLSLVPMTKLATSNLRKSELETLEQFQSRVGGAVTMTNPDKGFSTVDWAMMFADTTRKSFTKANKDMLSRAFDLGYVSKDAKTYMDIVFNPVTVLQNKEADGLIKKAVKGTGKRINQGLTYATDQTELLSRTFSFSMGVDVAKRSGIKSEKMQFVFAKQFSDNVVGNYSALNKPNIYRGLVPSLLGTFKTYRLNVMQQLLDTYGRRNTKGLAGFLGVQSVMFGGRSLPFSELYSKSLAPTESPESDYTMLLKKTGGNEALTRQLLYGYLGEKLDMDFSNKADVDFAKGGFTPFSSNMTLDNTVAMARLFTESKNLVNAVGDHLEVTGELNGGQIVEYLSQHNPIIGLKRGLGVFNNMDGTNYNVTKNGEIIKGSALNTILGIRTIEQGEGYREATKQRDRNFLEQEHLDKVRKSVRNSVRETEKGNTIIENKIINNVYENYIKGGGKPERFTEWYSQMISTATVDKMENQIINMGTPSDMQEVYDVYRMMSIGSYEQVK